MKVLVLGSARRELLPFYNNDKFIVKETGIGIALSAALSSHYIGNLKPDVILNAGSAGAFGNLEIGTCYRIKDVSSFDQDLSSYGLEKGVTLSPKGKKIGKIRLSGEGISLLSSSAFFSEKILPFDAGDMECYGIALASSLFSVPFVSVKLITDIVGEKRSLADIAGTVKENIDKLYEFSLSCLCSS